MFNFILSKGSDATKVSELIKLLPARRFTYIDARPTSNSMLWYLLSRRDNLAKIVVNFPGKGPRIHNVYKGVRDYYPLVKKWIIILSALYKVNGPEAINKIAHSTSDTAFAVAEFIVREASSAGVAMEYLSGEEYLDNLRQCSIGLKRVKFITRSYNTLMSNYFSKGPTIVFVDQGITWQNTMLAGVSVSLSYLVKNAHVGRVIALMGDNSTTKDLVHDLCIPEAKDLSAPVQSEKEIVIHSRGVYFIVGGYQCEYIVAREFARLKRSTASLANVKLHGELTLGVVSFSFKTSTGHSIKTLQLVRQLPISIQLRLFLLGGNND